MENQIFSTKKKRDDIVNSPNQKTIGFNFRKVVRSISGFSDIYRVFIKKCIFPKFTPTHPLHEGERPILVRDLSVKSHRLAAHFLTFNSPEVLGGKS